MKRIHRVAALALLAALSACDNVPSPTAPLRPKDLAPAFGIFDGAHGGGNTRFFFLPPMVSKPTINAEFHPGLRPRIDICEIENGVCKAGPTFKSFSAADVKVSTTEKHYHVNWDTRSPDVDTAKTYRIQVLLGDTPIGFADVDAVANGSLMKQVNANEYIPLVDGRTLPIKFFLGKGVTCEVNQSNCAEHTVTSAVGGDFAAADERFWLKFPANVFPAGFEEVTITIERKPVPRGKACHTLHLQGADSDEDTEPALAAEYEGCYRVTMDRNSDDFVEAGGFQRPVTVAMCLTGIERTNRLLRIYKSDPQPRGLVALEDADPAVIAGFSQACEGFEPTPLPNPDGPIGALQSGLRSLASAVGRLLTPKSLYAIDLGLGGEIGIGGGFSDFGWGIEGSLEAREPLTRTTTPGSSQAFSVSVHGFLHDHDEPDLDDVSSGEHGSEQSLAGVDVRFELLLDGTVVGSKVVTSALEEGDGDENGHIDAVASASFDFATVGTYSVRATLAHSGRSPVSFVVNVAEAGRITGSVISTGESPLVGAPVRLVSLTNADFTRSTTTGDGGVYTFENLPDGQYSIAAAAIGFNMARQTAVLDGEGRDKTIDFTLTPNLPDLTITQFSIGPAEPTQIDRVTYTVVIKNQGTADAPATTATLTTGFSGTDAEGNPVTQLGSEPFSVPALRAGESITLTWTEGPYPVSTRSASLFLNSGDLETGATIPETSTANNRASVSFRIILT